MPTFPHMGNPGFPGNNGDVYRYENVVDYAKWKPETRVRLLNVNWDSGYANVPGFETEEVRDAWFEKQPSTVEVLQVATELAPDGSIKLPLAYAQASMFNYLQVTFPTVPGAASQRRNWFYFITDLEALDRGATRFYLQRDEWTCFINDVSVNSMMLERGHYPVAESSVEAYLSDPIANNSMLLAPDVTAGSPRNVSSESHVIMNDKDMMACIATTANMGGSWGTKDASGWATPAASTNTAQGVPAPAVFAVKVADFGTFLSNVDSQLPNFKATVKAVFFASSKLLSLGSAFTFCGVSCNYVSAAQQSFELLKLSKEKFGYDARFADLAKLYTSPYAQIEIADENGVFATVNVEDCSNVVTLNASLQLAFPAIKIERSLTGINGAAQSFTFANLSERSFKGGGDWYKTLGSWEVPTFGILQSGHDATDYGTYYNRVQAQKAADNAYTSAEASAGNARSNVKASASTAQSNAYDSANTAVANTQRSSSAAVSNTATQTAANTAVMERSNSASATDTDLSNDLNDSNQAWDAGYSRDCQQAEATAENQSAAVTAASTAANVATSVATNPTGALGAVIGGIVQGAGAAINAGISINLASTKTEAGISNAQAKVDSGNANASQRNDNQRTANAYFTQTQNAASTAVTANNAATANSNAAASASTAKGNADRSKSTADSNADNTYSTTVANAARSKQTAESAIANAYAQGGLSAPSEFGSVAPGSAAVKPMGVFANVVTLPKGDVARIASQFKRWGYALDQYVDVSSWNVMKEFSYWKASDLWLVGSNGVPEAAQETIKAAIMNGVTVWRNPERIGEVSIYDN